MFPQPPALPHWVRRGWGLEDGWVGDATRQSPTQPTLWVQICCFSNLALLGIFPGMAQPLQNPLSSSPSPVPGTMQKEPRAKGPAA